MVLEAFRSGKTVDRLYVLDGCKDGPVQSIIREARKQDTMIQFVSKERLNQLSESGKHQGVIAVTASYHYSYRRGYAGTCQRKRRGSFFDPAG